MECVKEISRLFDQNTILQNKKDKIKKTMRGKGVIKTKKKQASSFNIGDKWRLPARPCD